MCGQSCFSKLKMTQKSFTVYHTEWSTYGRNYQVCDLPINFIPAISYAFVNVDASGNVMIADPYATIEKRFTDKGVLPLDNWNENGPFYGNFNQFLKLKQQGIPYKLTLAVGGWTFSKHFSSAVLPANQGNFVHSLVQLCLKYPIFDGISLDWEYLSNDNTNYGNPGNSTHPNDEQHFISFLVLLRQELTRHGLNFIISFCCAADPLKAKFNVKAINDLVDELHIMTYDFHSGNWGETITAHQSNTYPCSYAKLSVLDSVQAYLRLGASSEKIMIGVVAYSRGFSNTNGLGHSAQGGSTDKTWEEGIVDYKCLPLPGAQEYYDDKAGATYSYDPQKRILNSYDSPASIKAKCKLVHDMNLKGCLLWESSGDYPINHPKSVIAAMHKYLIKNDFND